jgi:hypothetical protein
LRNIFGQLELVTNWENEIPWDTKPWYINTLSDNISKLYSIHLDQQKKLEINSHNDEIELKYYNLSFSKFQNQYWININATFASIVNVLAEYCSTIVVTGSLADRNVAKGWSDLDCILALKKDVLSNGERLKTAICAIRSFKSHFKNIDQLSHHGFMVISECSFDGSSYNTIPLGLFDNAICLSGKNRLKLLRKKNYKQPNISLHANVKFFEDIILNREMKHHSRAGESLLFPLRYKLPQMYQLKYLTGRILLLPCIVTAKMNFDMGKKRAFEYVYSEEIFGDELRYFEQIRTNFSENKKNGQFIDKSINSKEYNENMNEVLHKLKCIT